MERSTPPAGMLRRDFAVLVASLVAIGALALLARATEPIPVAVRDLASHEGDLVEVRGTVASEPTGPVTARFFLRDATGAARVVWRLADVELHQGDGVAAAGRALWLRGAIELHADAVRRLAPTEAPSVRLPDLAREPHRFEGLLVRLEAFAEPGERDGHALLRDGSGAHRLEARFPAHLVPDGWVEWVGVLTYDEERMRYVFEARDASGAGP